MLAVRVSLASCARCCDVCKAQVDLLLPSNQEAVKFHTAPETAVPLPEPGHAELMWVISEQCTYAIITVVSLLLLAALNYGTVIHPHDKWRNIENYT